MFKKLIIVLALMWFAGVAQAAVTPNSFVTPQTPAAGGVNFVGGTDVAGTYKTVYTCSTANACKIMSLQASTTDGTAAHLVSCGRFVSTTQMSLTSTNVPLSSGNTAAALAVNLMSQTVFVGIPVDGNQNGFFYINTGETLQCTFATAITGTTVLMVYANVWAY